MRQIVIEKDMEGQRLNKFLGKYLDAAPQSFLYKMLRKKNIKLNAAKAGGNEILAAGDTVTIYMTDDTIKTFRKDGRIPQMDKSHQDASPEMVLPDGKKESECNTHRQKNPLAGVEILYEDEDFLILNKPVGVLSQKAQPSDYSLNEQIVDYYKYRHENNGLFIPSVCNRLDRNTSGIILAGMSLKGSRVLSKMLKERTVHKYYVTIVCGRVQKASVIKGFLTKKKNHNQVVIYKTIKEARKAGTEKPAYIETEYEPLQYGRFHDMDFTFLKVKLITGKTHQIRAHLCFSGHPIVGDGKYGNKPVNDILRKEFHLKHQLLHAFEMRFPGRDVEYELNKELANRTVQAELPEEFKRIKESLFEHGRKEYPEN